MYGKLKVNRGHLFPLQHAKDLDTQESTCILTNIVPQKESFNGGSWSRMETSVTDLMTANCKDNNNKVKAYVITGAVPSKTPENKMNDVNIPKLMWTAFCCKNKKGKWVSNAHWADNKKDENTQITIPTISLSDLYNIHKDDIGKLFPDGTCT